MVLVFLEMHAETPGEIILDRDATDDPVDEPGRIIPRIRQARLQTRIILRGDSGFCREEIMAWCEAGDIDDVSGLARRRRAATFRPSRRVAGKAERLPGSNGGNPRFVVTSPCRGQYRCAGTPRATVPRKGRNGKQDRGAAAPALRRQDILPGIRRRIGPRGTDPAAARIDTVRSRLPEPAGRITVTVRRVRLSLATAFPFGQVFMQALAGLRQAPVRAPPRQARSRP